jgi:hypothetical protein
MLLVFSETLHTLGRFCMHCHQFFPLFCVCLFTRYFCFLYFCFCFFRFNFFHGWTQQLLFILACYVTEKSPTFFLLCFSLLSYSYFSSICVLMKLIQCTLHCFSILLLVSIFFKLITNAVWHHDIFVSINFGAITFIRRNFPACLYIKKYKFSCDISDCIKYIRLSFFYNGYIFYLYKRKHKKPSSPLLIYQL